MHKSFKLLVYHTDIVYDVWPVGAVIKQCYELGVWLKCT